MPHLQDQSEAIAPKGNPFFVDGSSSRRTVDSSSTASGEHLPIKEAKEGFLGISDPDVAMANKVSMMAADKVEEESFDSTEESAGVDASTPPAGTRTSKTLITPSPSIQGQRRLTTNSSPSNAPTSPKSANKSGAPVLTIYGNSRLFHSPIRVKRRVSHSEDDDEEETTTLQQSVANNATQPTHLRYGGESPPIEPTRPVLIRRGSSAGKRAAVEDSKESDETKDAESPIMKKRKVDGKEEAALQAAVEAASAMAGMRKKPIISPASSAEKGDDDEQQGFRPVSATIDPRAHPNFYHSHHHPGVPPLRHLHPSASFGAVGGYPMYHGYPPHVLGPPGHMHSGHHHPGGTGFYPPYHPPPPSVLHPYRQRPAFAPTHGAVAGHMPPRATVSRSSSNLEGKTPSAAAAAAAGSGTSSKDVVQVSSGANSPSFKSVSDWQQATMSSGGRPPSANRCVPLKGPVPSKFWGEAEKTKEVVLPDFHRLVNYPDYLSKTRGDTNSPDGKKNCVMCGKLRICSATSLVNKGRISASKSADPSETEDTSHIIPRQNKGLCTACDVTVWVVVADGLEIKWCKGCKNFRPWAAFGDKGSATKCVRCRERQREKYAMQKDEMRSRRFRPSSTSSTTTTTSGLEVLMNAATSV